MENFKYLALLQVMSAHPALVTLTQSIIAAVQPHMTEINQAIGEAEVILQRINSARTVSEAEAMLKGPQA